MVNRENLILLSEDAREPGQGELSDMLLLVSGCVAKGAPMNPVTRDVVLTVAWCAEREHQHRLADLLYAVGGMMLEADGFRDAMPVDEPKFNEVIDEYARVGRRITRDSIGGV